MRLQILTEISAGELTKYLLCALGLIVFFLPLSSGAQDMNKPPTNWTSVDEQCAENLHRIYMLIERYLHHSGGALSFPSDLDEVYLMAKDPKPLICPLDKEVEEGKPDGFRTSYEIVSDPLQPKLARISARRIAIVIEKRANHNGQRLVLFYDGSVRAFDDQQFDRLKTHSFVDKEPSEAQTVDLTSGHQ
jgi:hypothetical protein